MTRILSRQFGLLAVAAWSTLAIGPLSATGVARASCADRHYTTGGPGVVLTGVSGMGELLALIESTGGDRSSVPAPSPCAGMSCAGDPVPPLTSPVSPTPTSQERGACLIGAGPDECQQLENRLEDEATVLPIRQGLGLFRPPR